MTVFENIKKFAHLRKMSLQEVAEKAGLGKNTIYKYGQGKNPSMATLQKIADALHVSKTDLLEAETDTKTADIDDDELILTFDGRPIDDEDMEIIKRLLRGKNDK